jgi:hypothetical protein
MPYFKRENLLFIHIPKTGGTSIEKYFANRLNLKLGPEQHYLSYYPKTIDQEITKMRKSLKRVISNNKSKQMLSINNINKFNIDIECRENTQEFKHLQKARLSKEIGHSLQHLTWNEICINKDILWDTVKEKRITSHNPYDRNEYEILTIVRNPYDRIISELLFRKLITNQTIVNKEIVNIKIRYFLNNDDTYDNHKIPQYNFLIDEQGRIIENITILKTETLTQDMKRIGYSDFDHYYQTSKCKVIEGATKYINSFNSESIQIVNEYYKKDFEIFGYTML